MFIRHTLFAKHLVQLATLTQFTYFHMFLLAYTQSQNSFFSFFQVHNHYMVHSIKGRLFNNIYYCLMLHK